MALDTTAAAAAAATFCAATGNPAALPVITQLVQAIFDSIVANAVVSPTSGTAMSVLVGAPGATPVTGTGTIT